MEVSLFSYRRGNSPMHRINAGVKLVFLIAFSFFVFYNDSWIFLTVCLCLSWICFFLAGANWRGLLSLRFVFVIGLFLTLFKMTDSVRLGLEYGLVYTSRFFISAFMAQTVFETTTILEIKDSLHLPNVIALAINFIPQIFHEWKKIRLASRARRPKTKNIVRNISAFLFELQALFLTMLSKAENVRRALENRSRR
ncbi:MAG: energy-coupling factor transporter transmembrane protein EcfT [Treponema sp.]|nr:energy-coupling factor transporter transmembrane protein EcfT [Treponema sp.]